MYDEILLSYSLLFSRDHESREIAAKLFSPHKMNTVFVSRETTDPPPRSIMIMDWDTHYGPRISTLRDFQRYRNHLGIIQSKINDRKRINMAYDKWSQGLVDKTPPIPGAIF